MTKILDRLPLVDRRTSIAFDNQRVKVHRNQAPVWVSIHLTGVPQLEPGIPKIPALLDLGNNFDFCIQYRQLQEWTGMDPALLRLLGELEIDGRTVDRREATVWLYPNTRGTRDIALEKPPQLLEMTKGIAVYPRDAVPPGPRLPLLGVAA